MRSNEIGYVSGIRQLDDSHSGERRVILQVESERGFEFVGLRLSPRQVNSIDGDVGMLMQDVEISRGLQPGDKDKGLNGVVYNLKYRDERNYSGVGIILGSLDYGF